MNAKDKANELVHRYYLPHPFQKLSKQFALTNVDEIIKTISLDFIRCNNRMQTVTYWEEVKEEINNL